MRGGERGHQRGGADAVAAFADQVEPVGAAGDEAVDVQAVTWAGAHQVQDLLVGEGLQYEAEAHRGGGDRLGCARAAVGAQVLDPAGRRRRVGAQDGVRGVVGEVAGPGQHVTHRPAVEGGGVQQTAQHGFAGAFEEAGVAVPAKGSGGDHGPGAGERLAYVVAAGDGVPPARGGPAQQPVWVEHVRAARGSAGGVGGEGDQVGFGGGGHDGAGGVDDPPDRESGGFAGPRRRDDEGGVLRPQSYG